MSLQQNVWDNPDLIKNLQNSKVVVMPTDTIYGIVGRALDRGVVERIYEIRKRAPTKPCIILISDLSELEKFSVNLTTEQKNIIANFSTPTSFILDCTDDSFLYLHRGTNSLAFRIPQQEELRELLSKTGPLIAPSANIEKFPESEDIEDARKYFGDAVDLYIDGGPARSKPSRVIKLQKDGAILVLRD